MQTEIKITDHAYDRAKERLGWKPATANRMKDRIFHRGLRFEETKGSLREYIKELRYKHPYARNTRVYGDNLFFFRGKKLVTLYRMPSEYVTLANKIQKRVKNNQ